ncbi:hypothetical protein SESBI_28464 [Sesbania bispinosa]|nr:hypothetical protein SESBI_28464 [Sesbania bispinosa]
MAYLAETGRTEEEQSKPGLTPYQSEPGREQRKRKITQSEAPKCNDSMKGHDRRLPRQHKALDDVKLRK